MPPDSTTSHGGCLRNPDSLCVVRVDATSQIGTGHFMRCLALADALRQRGSRRVRFVSRQLPDRMRELVMQRGHELTLLPPAGDADAIDELAHAHWLGTSQRADAELTAETFAGKQAEWLVVDHYGLDTRWESALRPHAKNILVVDDLADRSHDCELLLDQNLHDDAEARYASRVSARCRTLLGPKFALLREEFRNSRASASARARDGSVRRVLILMGGVDRANLTAIAIDAVTALRRQLRVDVVVSEQHESHSEIAAACRKHGYALHVQPPNIAELMAAADLSIGAGGSTTWERCCVGLPTIAFIVSENQRQLVINSALKGLLYAPDLDPPDAESIAGHLRSLLDNPLLLRALSRNGLDTVDGRGTQRVLRAMGCTAIAIRQATQNDSSRMLGWRNHPQVRGASVDPGSIDPSRHQSWFASVLADPDSFLLIGEHGEDAVGVVRWDVRDGKAEVSIYLVPGLAGEGRGADLLHAAESWLISRRPDVRTLQALVLRGNEPSHLLFEACGYCRGSTQYAKEVVRP